MPRGPSDLPINETLAVFLGVNGFEWLSKGQADAFNAATIALCTGLLVYLVRKYFRKNDNTTR
jgi:hypothetical protein